MNNEILTSGLPKAKELLLSGLNYNNLSADLNFLVIVYDDPSIETMLTGSINSDIAKLNRVQIINANDRNTEHSINCSHYNLRDSTSGDNWLSNVESGCELKDVIDYKNDFLPILNTGSYSIFDRLQRFFSSYSVNLLMNDQDTYTIENYEIVNPQATIYKRDSKFNNTPFRIWDCEVTYEKNENNKFDSIIHVVNYIVEKYPVVNSENLNLNEAVNIDHLNNYYEKFHKPQNVSVFTIYTKYFPIKPNTLIIYKVINNTITEVTENLEINNHNGIIKINPVSFNEEDYFILYTTTPRIDYEISEFDKIRFDSKIKLRPENSFYQTGCIAISFSEKNLQRIVLDCSKNNVFIGSDVSLLTATCYDSNNNTVSEIPVFFEFLDENENNVLGFLNNESKTFDQTNSDGIARCVYFAPYRNESLRHDVNSIDGSILKVSTDNSNITRNDVCLFFLRNTFETNFGEDQLILMYEYNSGSTQYVPTKPFHITFQNNEISIFYNSNFTGVDANELFVFMPKIVKIRAYAIDPATSTKIYSNQIAIKLSFPYYLRGSFIDDEGFRFKKMQNSDFATGIGGSNYFAINKNDSENFKTIILSKQ